MGKKKNLGQFFTKNSQYIIGNLLNVFPENAVVIDPFVGEWDLLNTIPSNFEKIGYDISPQAKYPDTIKQNTLLEPPDYSNKWICTNPPYLARNKNNNVSNNGTQFKAINEKLYNETKLNDLYKIALNTMLDCAGGIIIVPLNFFCEEGNDIRRKFLSVFKILQLNIFEETVFKDTSYTVCSFSFIRSLEVIKSQIINVKFFPNGDEKIFNIEEKSNFRLGAEFYSIIENKSKIKISRIIDGDTSISHIKLRAIDSGSINGKIKLEWSDITHIDKTPNKTERTFCSFKFGDVKITENEERFLIIKFNEILEKYREKYNSLFLTNFRNSSKSYARKRISFDVAYNIASHIIEENKESFPSFSNYFN